MAGGNTTSSASHEAAATEEDIRTPSNTHQRAKRQAPAASGSDEGTNSEDDDAHQDPRQTSVEAMLLLMHSVHQASTDDIVPRPHIRRAGVSAPPKKRRPTHTVRKEAISDLTDEVARLEQRLAFLRGQAITAQNSRGNGQGEDDQEPQPEHPYAPNSLLRDTIHEQQLKLACARSIVSKYLTNDYTFPIHYYIHLTKSKGERQRTLRLIKPQQVRLAKRYVLERSRHLDLTKPHASSERFINARGDAVYLGFSIIQLSGTLTVHEIFDAASFFTTNLEISYTDGAGRVTIREQEDESDDPSICHHHFLTNMTDDLLLEGNLVMLHHFDQEQDFGIFTTIFVDRDDLHPYRMKERLRQDVTAVLMISKENGMIVLRRMGHVRIHRNENLHVKDSLLLELAEGVLHWSNALFEHAKSSFGVH